MAKHTKQEKIDAVARLKGWMPEGSQVFTVLRGVSRSGMSRDISVVTLHADGQPGRELYAMHPNHAAAVVLGDPLVRSMGGDAVRVRGAGMDMGFDLVYRLSYALYGRGDALVQRWI